LAPGNSGSPITDRAGKVVAMVQGGFNLDSFFDQLEDQGMLLDGKLGYVYLGTNLACLNLPTETKRHPLDAACTQKVSGLNQADTEDNLMHHLSPAAYHKLRADAQKQVDLWKFSRPSSFFWKPASVDPSTLIPSWYHYQSTDHFVIATPTCIEPAGKWMDAYRDANGAYLQSAKVDLTLPIWRERMGYSAVMQIDDQIELVPSQLWAEVSFNPAEFALTSQSIVNLQSFAPCLHSSDAILIAYLYRESACGA
jgi:hypothetical protein